MDQEASIYAPEKPRWQKAVARNWVIWAKALLVLLSLSASANCMFQLKLRLKYRSSAMKSFASAAMRVGTHMNLQQNEVVNC